MMGHLFGKLVCVWLDATSSFVKARPCPDQTCPGLILKLIGLKKQQQKLECTLGQKIMKIDIKSMLLGTV